jgi:hypothetical protein
MMCSANKKTLIIICLLPFPAISYSYELSSVYFDPNYWKNFDWVNAEQSALWKLPDFKAESTSEISNVILYRKSQSFSFDSQGFKADINKLNKADYPFTTIISPQQVNNSSCELLYSKLVKVFGSSSEMMDNTFNFFGSHVEKNWQWDIGTTRVTISCGDNGENSSKFASIRYEHLDSMSKIEKPIHLNCSRRHRIFLDGHQSDWTNLKPLTISVFPYYKVITNADKYVITTINKFSDSLINFTLKNDSIESEYSISRIDGSLSGLGKSLKNSAMQSILEGSCEVRDPSARKF